MTAAALFDLITVCCFCCPHKVTGTTPQEAHDLMEAHYADKHAARITALTGDGGRR